MVLRRLRYTIALGLLAAGALGAGTALPAEFRPYSATGEWFQPGHTESGYYNSVCWNWVNNTFSKSPTAWGLITFIDQSGNWNHGMQGYDILRRNLTLSESWGTKKPMCRNNAWYGYQGGCFGYMERVQCV
jgi:hypothetical protein